MRSAFVRRKIDQQHDEFRVQVRVWTKKISGPVTNKLRLDADCRPFFAHRIERAFDRESFEHCLGHVGAEKPRVEIVPKLFLLSRANRWSSRRSYLADLGAESDRVSASLPRKGFHTKCSPADFLKAPVILVRKDVVEAKVRVRVEQHLSLAQTIRKMSERIRHD